MEIHYVSLHSKLDTIDSSIKSGLEGILELDFTNQKDKFVVDPDFHGWTKENIEFAELLYKNYLYLCLKYPNVERLPPSIDVDDFWHGHILDTRRYSDDCKKIFGRMLHHNPYFGYGSVTAKAELTDGFEVTQELHEQEFGAPIFEVRH